ncbi:MAG: DUF2069 domain-containing protein [Betaproteobacteria bacterium]
MAAFGARWTTLGLATLTLLELLWETVLAPQHASGVLFALKSVPLALLFPGVAQGARRSRQWLALLLPLYFAEALTRALSEHGRHAVVAGMAAAIAAATFLSLMVWFRAEPTRRRK